MPVVYTAGNLSLAMLEMLVQDQPLRARDVTIAAEVPPGLDIERADMDRLPADWRHPAARRPCAPSAVSGPPGLRPRYWPSPAR